MTQIPILTYHGIQASDGEYDWQEWEKPYVLSASSFDTQLDHLSRAGIETLGLGGLSSWSAAHGTEAVMLTFDDGHRSHFDHVVPNLKQRNMKGVFFVSAGLVGQKGFMDWDHLREMLTQGFEIGSHGVHHVPLTPLSDEAIREEVAVSKVILEEKLACEIKSFSVPRGFFQRRIREAVQKAGYSCMFTSSFGQNRAACDLFHLKRIAITGRTSFETFERYVRGEFGASLYTEGIKEIIRNGLGPRWYDKLAAVRRKFE